METNNMDWPPDWLQEAMIRLKVAQHLIDVGYRGLAKEHSDKGGSAEDMARLDCVCEQLLHEAIAGIILREWKYRSLSKPHLQ